jgi:hypothetical protein
MMAIGTMYYERLVAQIRKERDEALEALAMAIEWIDSVPKDTTLPTMPGFDRDSVDAILAKRKVDK